MSARNSLSSAIVALSAFALHVHAQTPAPVPRPSFEVASIKRNLSLGNRSGTRNSPGGRVTITNERLRQVIRSAYGSNDLEVIGGPDWLDNDRWDIVATADTDNADAEWRLMLQSLLAERFKLVAHVEIRERPIYDLVFARSDRQLGPAIHPTKSECTGDDCGSTNAVTNGIVSGVITGTAATMTQIGKSLSGSAERRVFDRTGLAGKYDFELRWSEDVSIFTALPEQLGLKLESQRGPVDIVVVDSVERATED